MTGPGGMVGFQQPSHEVLIEMVPKASRPTSAGARPDAIIVPAARPARNLMTAIDLAKAAGCHLVVLCSVQTQPAEVRTLFDAKNFTMGIAIGIPRDYSIHSLELETTEWVKHAPGSRVCGGRNSDLSVKRNTGLLIARMLGWRHIFFMDDDIRGITVGELSRTVSALGTGGSGYRSAGMPVERFHASEMQPEHFESSSMQVKHFPDNSVVCHARRLVGERQDVFVSGSVLAVDSMAPFDFFPDIYNEDWLFFYRNVATRRLSSPGLHATQMKQVKYNPFADPQRAAREEFGDVIAEGLYALLHSRDFGHHCPTNEYWKRFLTDRYAILDSVTKQLQEAPSELRDKIREAIATARKTLEKITSQMCVDYIAAWQRDLHRWAVLRDSLPRRGSVPDVLQELRLRP